MTRRNVPHLRDELSRVTFRHSFNGRLIAFLILPIVCRGCRLFALRRLGRKIPPAGLHIQAVLVDLHLQVVIRPCGLHVLERNLEQIQVLRRGRQALQPVLKIIIVVEESSAGSVCQFCHRILARLHCRQAILRGLSKRVTDGGIATLARVCISLVEPTRVQRVDDDIRAGSPVQ